MKNLVITFPSFLCQMSDRKELKTEDNRNKFNEEVIIPLIKKVDDYSDTSELFIRSIKLYKQVKENK